jgi:predicted ATPase
MNVASSGLRGPVFERAAQRTVLPQSYTRIWLTNRSTIKWSYELLEEGEKVLFTRLSVFAGGRTMEAIEAICDAGGDLAVDVLDGLTSLVDKSLLKQEEGVGENCAS